MLQSPLIILLILITSVMFPKFILDTVINSVNQVDQYGMILRPVVSFETY
jgi:hypothetical protein